MKKWTTKVCRINHDSLPFTVYEGVDSRFEGECWRVVWLIRTHEFDANTKPYTHRGDKWGLEPLPFLALTHYGGPGQSFCRRPYVIRHETWTKISQSGGLDI